MICGLAGSDIQHCQPIQEGDKLAENLCCWGQICHSEICLLFGTMILTDNQSILIFFNKLTLQIPYSLYQVPKISLFQYLGSALL